MQTLFNKSADSCAEQPLTIDMKSSIILLSTLVSQAVAHFGLTYPAWRIDSLVETNDSISQWTYPCANVVTGQNASQARTLWPLEGGSIVLELHHKWTYLFSTWVLETRSPTSTSV